MSRNKKTIVILHGSLRDNSSSAAVIRKAVQMIGDKANVILYKGTGQLPHFDDKAAIPAEVIAFRKLIFDADGILICTPEYVFGIPGTLKNALDWTVGSGEFDRKPTALITASSIGEKGHAALLHVLTAISCKLNDNTNLLISFIRSKINVEGEVTDATTVKEIESVTDALLRLMNEPVTC
ncbi:MAG: NAD(P)H-dependent oxidoreductase [Sphingobacteriales bacterium]|nr:NAD(P)H-dependent oxidoreductase [Sphingobacteriales bacterium]